VRSSAFVLSGVLACGVAWAAPPASNPWSPLVQKGARWTLIETTAEAGVPPRKIIVETRDVRIVGDATVARLRWTLVTGAEKSNIGDSNSGRYTQLAVTPAGIYLLDADQDDAAVLAALKRKPSRSNPPKEYKGTKQNEGRFLRKDGASICMGVEPLPDAGDCPDTCDAELCITKSGLSRLDGFWAPDAGIFEVR
jgi:hypothetical protein